MITLSYGTLALCLLGTALLTAILFSQRNRKKHKAIQERLKALSEELSKSRAQVERQNERYALLSKVAEERLHVIDECHNTITDLENSSRLLRNDT
ncbi:hypothetical protein CN157_09385 [Sinorhizobium meliloti]|uniref:hypothetical protein n=1 Tax=Sinorhizobium TaxID=28105 RepID=UPI000FDA2647|nr:MULTISPECIES: hypothetical protein [Sinorhizobium]RVK19443.1 hypothetical protein CN165_12810 [Sinorhizobium medicae]RVK79390.1 hypothetical protein CN157_09385 [Sinorhizobium meliloti]RVQ76355.1 hypothetical protein CN061_13830 [Sinorhizobium meliloti]TWA34065.1 hypothetical protein FB009_11774 [Sinorhizobium medicae]